MESEPKLVSLRSIVVCGVISFVLTAGALRNSGVVFREAGGIFAGVFVAVFLLSLASRWILRSVIRRKRSNDRIA